MVGRENIRCENNVAAEHAAQAAHACNSINRANANEENNGTGSTSSSTNCMNGINARNAENRAKAGRRVVALSRVDRQRLERGEFSYPEEVLKQYDYRPPTPEELAATVRRKPAHAQAEHEQLATHNTQKNLTAHDREILANVPPHFGKL